MAVWRRLVVRRQTGRARACSIASLSAKRRSRMGRAIACEEQAGRRAEGEQDGGRAARARGCAAGRTDGQEGRG
eukprot:820675-Prymnesium_polylepis.1